MSFFRERTLYDSQLKCVAEEMQSRLKCFLKALSKIEASIMTAKHLSKLGEGSKVNSALFVLRSKSDAKRIRLQEKEVSRNWQ